MAASNPACVKTPIILRFSGSTDAVKPGEAHLAGPHGQVLEQDGGEPPAVVGVVDEEGHLGLGPVTPAVVAGDTDQLVAAERHQGHAVDVVDGGEPLHVPVRQPGPRAEVPVVDALRRLARVEGEEPARVVGPDGADVRGGPVGEHDVRLEGDRVAVRDAAAVTPPPPAP